MNDRKNEGDEPRREEKTHEDREWTLDERHRLPELLAVVERDAVGPDIGVVQVKWVGG